MAEQMAIFPHKISENNVILNNASLDETQTVAQTETSSEIHDKHGEEIFYQSAEFWVGFAFVLVVVTLIKPIGKALKALLVKRQNQIIDQISQAEQLRNDAQLLLAQYEKKFLHVKDEAGVILDNSEKEIELLKNEEIQKLERDLDVRRKEVENSISATAEKVKNEINQKIAALTVNKVKAYIGSNLSPAKHADLIDKSLDKIVQKIAQLQQK